MNNTMQDRKALYYPYIHIRDVDWLKATLLCFPQVRRMIPPHLRNGDDDPRILDFFAIVNHRGEPLLADECLDMYDNSSSVYLAQERLLRKLEDHEDYLRSRYSRQSISQQGAPAPVKLHFEKIRAELWKYLLDKKLAWNEQGSVNRPTYDTWVEMHPKLADAIMSTIAISIARREGLDIVTDSRDIHYSIAVQNEQEVFRELFNDDYGQDLDLPTQEKVDELAAVVMYTAFDVSRLTADQIGDLIKDGKDLRQFKDGIAKFAMRVPTIRDGEVRRRAFEDAAKEVIEDWHKYRKSLPKYAIDALYEASKTEVPAWALALVAGAAAWQTVLGAGLALAVVAYNGFNIWNNFRDEAASPYCYLSRVHKAGATLVGHRPFDQRSSRQVEGAKPPNPATPADA